MLHIMDSPVWAYGHDEPIAFVRVVVDSGGAIIGYWTQPNPAEGPREYDYGYAYFIHHKLEKGHYKPVHPHTSVGDVVYYQDGDPRFVEANDDGGDAVIVKDTSALDDFDPGRTERHAQEYGRRHFDYEGGYL